MAGEVFRDLIATPGDEIVLLWGNSITRCSKKSLFPIWDMKQKPTYRSGH
jgi:hypothetical protein